jgi:hypothetical protein
MGFKFCLPKNPEMEAEDELRQLMSTCIQIGAIFLVRRPKSPYFYGEIHRYSIPNFHPKFGIVGSLSV